MDLAVSYTSTAAAVFSGVTAVLAVSNTSFPVYIHSSNQLRLRYRNRSAAGTT
jgi:hypothetical protein